MGERGAQGPPGATGAIGAMGAQGSPGVRGERGERGERGDAGPAGAQGETGSMGEMGALGTMGPTGPAGRFDLEDANGTRLGTLVAADIPDAWWVMNDADTLIGYNYFGGTLHPLSGGNSDLFYASNDCTGDAYALIAVVGAGVTNSGELYRLEGPALQGLPIHSLKPANGSACMENLTSTRNAQAAMPVGSMPADGVVPFRLVERP